MGERAAAFVKQSQSEIVRAFELADGKAFKREEWSNGANHGIACVLQEGQVFEKVCVFVSVMRGTLPKGACAVTSIAVSTALGISFLRLTLPP